MKDSKIPWCHTFNPWRCCDNARIVAAESSWAEPIKWHEAAKEAGERRRVFCMSLGDVFENWQRNMVDSEGRVLSATNSAVEPFYAPFAANAADQFGPIAMDAIRQRLFRLIRDTPCLDWMLLTGAPYNVMPIVSRKAKHIWQNGFPDNVWIGTSVEDQAAADERIPHLLTIPAKVRFLSMEPLLGEVDLRLNKVVSGGIFGAIHWVIVGGESGGDARFCEIRWIRSIVRQCQAASVPVFVKQLGTCPVGSFLPRMNGAGGQFYQGVESVITDPKGGDPDEWPEDLRVREVPG